MCDILPQRRFSLAPADHGSSFDKKREEILQRPVKIPSPPQAKQFEESEMCMDEGYASWSFVFIVLYVHHRTNILASYTYTCCSSSLAPLHLIIRYTSNDIMHTRYILVIHDAMLLCDSVRCLLYPSNVHNRKEQRTTMDWNAEFQAAVDDVSTKG